MSRLNVDKITGATGTASGAPITLSGDTATLGSGADIKGAINASGTAPIYACRAWIYFDGTSGSIGTGSGSGNVSSVTDHGTGDYTVNFTTAMPDANYCSVFSSNDAAGSGTNSPIATGRRGTAQTTTAVGVRTKFNQDSSLADNDYIFVAVFR